MPKKCEDVVTLQGEIYIRKGSQEERKVAKVQSVQKHPYTIGKQWFVMTATFFYVGDLTAVTEQELVLERAAMIPETGRFNEFLKTGNSKECEPCNGPVVINRQAIIAAMPSPAVSIEVR
jgi:hypothetical protein